MNEVFSPIQNVDTMFSQSTLVSLDSVAFASENGGRGRGRGRVLGGGHGSWGGYGKDRY